ncbi:hypothetical protein N7517_009691 [Penicillium concentricum]|uniref:Uncharacterized protein n=1 Tax=Penicillium concentricum TaxID=293559 RepID=A0A9W9RHX4_9EURO|nr:uncharacterized protein N7517_009691 [Penicillium concentricum]KAJ5360500.1 hypothetical protein N7517_009691 [Penicillium concentricum]
MLKFLIDGGDWHGLLEDMCNIVHKNRMWGEPKARTGLSYMKREIGRSQGLRKEAHDFIYGEGKNPFHDSYCDTMELES